MRAWQFSRLGVVCTCVLLSGFSARAETLAGTVLDPQKHPIAGAQVTLICNAQADIRMTNDEGHFSFNRPVFPANCRIRAFYKGFATLEFAIGHSRALVLKLRLAEVVQTVNARSDPMLPNSMTSISLSSNDLRRVSDDSDTLVAYAKQLAGVYSGPDHIYVDGLPAEELPPAQSIESILVNPDPFSAEYSDGSGTHIDIITKSPDRKFHFHTGGIPVGGTTRDGLDPRLKSSSTTATLGLSGPVPDLPLSFNSDLNFNDRRKEVPIEAVVPAIAGSPITPDTAAPATDSNLLADFAVHYAGGKDFRVDSSLYFAMGRHTNMNVSGLTLPEAGIAVNKIAREFRTTITKTGAHYIYRGGIVADWLNQDSRANSDALGVSVSGAFIGGGAQIKNANSETMRWSLKNVLSFDAGKHLWSFGATVSRSSDEESVVPNPLGYIQFNNLQDYIMSATTGAQTGTALIVQGNGNAGYASRAVSPFIEGELVRWHTGTVRGGLRADYQTGGGLLFSPRLSMSASVLHGWVVRAGSGMFVQNWRNSTFLSVLENDGHHLHRVLIPNASLSDLTQATGEPAPEVTSAVAPNLALPREWMSKASIERSLRNFVPGLEYTWTAGSHLLGSDRLPTETGWTDLLESNRALRKQQIHLRTQYKFAGQSLTAHYEWIRSFDDTDGPFSFPEIPGDLKDEWARSSGVSPHNVTIAGNFQLRGGVFINLVGSWRSSAPYNITTGLDPEHDGLFNDRGGLPRNSGDSQAYRNLSLYASRRFRMPWLAKKWKEKLYGNLDLQAENILDNRNYLALDAVQGSPIFGQPLSALPGRSVRLNLNLSQ